MDLFDLLNHWLNFLAPALWLALLLPLAARLALKTKGWANYSLLAQVAIHFLVAALALGLGLWFSAMTARWQPTLAWCCYVPAASG